MPIKYKKVRKTTQVADTYECDVCKTIYTPDDIFETQEMVVIETTCGYGSVFGDGTKLNVCICQHCLKKVLEGKV